MPGCQLQETEMNWGGGVGGVEWQPCQAEEQGRWAHLVAAATAVAHEEVCRAQTAAAVGADSSGHR